MIELLVVIMLTFAGLVVKASFLDYLDEVRK
jgi:hypothetical protein